MTTLFIDISSDNVYLSCKKEELFLERNGIENTLGKILVQWQRDNHFTKAYILNGPGGFTNLRVGSLCLNLLNTLIDNQIDMYSVSKIDLYTYGHQKDVVEPYGIIYIGQKNNVRLWDFEKKEKIGQYNFEQLTQMLEAGTLPQPLFLDTVYDRTYYPDVLVHSTAVSLDKSVWKQLMKEYLEETSLIPTKHIEANYMIEPNIGCA